MKAFVDFYKKESISPVSQDISDIGRHYRRRAALYRHLGIIPALVEGKRVLEFGPGSGHNSLYTASLKPESYVLVEGNPVGQEKTKSLLHAHYPKQNIEIHSSLIEEYQDERRFDLVLCEGLLPLQEDPVGIIRRVASFLAPGGCLVVTCTDAVTYFPELLRRLFALIITDPSQNTETKLKILLPVFSPQLGKIEGMSRPHDEYILDNILQPFFGRKLFGMDDMIDAIQDLLTAYDTSPRFVQDWRWYKKIVGPTRDFNEIHKKSYLQEQYNFLDSRTNEVGEIPESKHRLSSLCKEVYELILSYEKEREDTDLLAIKERLEDIETLVRKWSDKTADSLRNYIENFDKACVGETNYEWTDFCDWFGQGQIYVSLLNDID